MRAIQLGKSRTNRRGLTREQQLIKENQVLKRECQRLKKMLARNELSRYENVKEAVEEFEKNSDLGTTREFLESLKKEWKCKRATCEGYLEIFTFNKIDKVYYYRLCTHCDNRTPSKRYDSKTVKGIMKEAK